MTSFIFFTKHEENQPCFPPRKAAKRSIRSNGYTSKEKLCCHEQADKHSHTIYATHIEREKESETTKYVPKKGVALMLRFYVYSLSSFPALRRTFCIATKSERFYATLEFNYILNER